MTGAPEPQTPRPAPADRRRLGWVAAAMVVSLLVVSLLGSNLSPIVAVGGLVLKLHALWPGLVYLLAAFGLAWPLRSLWRDTEDASPIQLAVGLAIMLSASHLLGVLGLLNTATAIGLCVIGVGMAAVQLARAIRTTRSGFLSLDNGQATILALACPAAAVLVIAALMPPGWLWQSEYGGFDALSYHLQLPQEWLAAGRIAPVEHNVYSYLPGYIESAFVHIGALTLAPAENGLLAGDGWRLLACQSLHAGVAIVAAWLTARAATRIALRAGVETTTAHWGGAVAGCLALTTPWAVVTGSLAYNEAGVNAMLAGVLVVCAQERLSPRVRGALVGLLVGVACGCKPTALFFVGVPAGVLLLGSIRGGKAVAAAVAAGAAVGLAALTPWLVRNAVHGGNPVFPFASGMFGTAHWTAEQLSRYEGAHTFEGPITDRLRTLVWTSPSASPGDPAVVRFRGLANPQWGVLPLAAVGAAAVLLFRRSRLRTTGSLLAACVLAQLVAWLAFTHLQSRFLLPMLPLGAVLIGLAITRLRTLAGDRPDARGGVTLLAGAVIGAQAVLAGLLYMGQRDGFVGQGLVVFPSFFTNTDLDDPASTATGWCNTRPKDNGLVLLVGGSTPLYYGSGVVYHTTYDTSPVGELLRATPDDPAAVARGLRELGIGWLLVDPGELQRLQESGWYDPDVTPDRLHALTEALGGPEIVWPEARQYLLRIAPDGTP